MRGVFSGPLHLYTFIHTFIILMCVFIHMTVKRVNITLEETLHNEATSYAEGRGMSFSAFVSRSLKDAMKQGDSSPSVSLTPEAFLKTMTQEERTGLVKPVVSDILRSDWGRDYLRGIVKEMTPGERGRAPRGEVSGGHGEAPKIRPGNIELAPEFVERLKKFGPTKIQNASCVDKGTISSIQNRKKVAVTPVTFEKLEAGISALEAEAAKNSLIPSE